MICSKLPATDLEPWCVGLLNYIHHQNAPSSSYLKLQVQRPSHHPSLILYTLQEWTTEINGGSMATQDQDTDTVIVMAKCYEHNMSHYDTGIEEA